MRRAAKRVRASYAAEHSANNNHPQNETLAMAIGREAAALLEREALGLGDLPREVALYWLNTSNLNECAKDDGIPEASLERLLLMHEFLTGGNPETFSKEDWVEISGMVNDNSESLDIRTLTAMMSTLLEHGALN